ncbi:MAG: hypothetical protein [Caudoviricetes sp.]|nr:MAG: hypothetical protein [Caudoviricetes sp.]
MAYCKKCPYTTKIKRKYGETIHCKLEPTNMDVSYYCSDKRDNEENLLCPFLNYQTRREDINYGEYLISDMPEKYFYFFKTEFDYSRSVIKFAIQEGRYTLDEIKKMSDIELLMIMDEHDRFIERK